VKRLVSFLLLFVSPLALAPLGYAQAPPAPKGPENPKAAAQIDITGQWVAVVSEDWVYRMVVGPKGDAGSIPLNDAGKKVAGEWDPANTNSCKAYGAAGIIRMPSRLRISWQDDRTMKMEFDAGTQTRLLHFSNELPPIGYPSSEPPRAFRTPANAGAPTMAGYSVAAWHKQGQSRGLGFGGPPVMPAQKGSLSVLTTNMLPGYLQSNGIPYSDDTVLKEHFNVITLPDNSQWLIVTSIVEDPKYLSTPWVISTQFKKEVGADKKWRPTTCT
jgi:hypothetical protein